MLKKFGSATVSDDLEALRRGKHESNLAKCLLVDPADYMTQHIWFDDGEDDGHTCEIDVRNVVTGE